MSFTQLDVEQSVLDQRRDGGGGGGGGGGIWEIWSISDSFIRICREADLTENSGRVFFDDEIQFIGGCFSFAAD